MCTLLQRPSMPTSPALKPLSSPPPSPPSSPHPPFFPFSAGTLPLTLPFNFSLPSAADAPTPPFSFSFGSSKASVQHDNPRKRRRRLTDVDGDLTSALLRKKRRLRLTLVTSRLSQPYSSPATNIVDRGTNRAAVWARIRNGNGRKGITGVATGSKFSAAGANATVSGYAMPEPLLRKAAILNRLRLQRRPQNGEPMVSDASLKCQLRSQEPKSLASGVTDEPFVEALTTENERIESPNMVAAGKPPYAPILPSPLGMTNYDALDLEDDYLDDEETEDYRSDASSGGRRRESIYSDFSVFDSNGSQDDDDDDGFGSLGFSAIPE